MRRGLAAVVPEHLLTLFTWDELEVRPQPHNILRYSEAEPCTDMHAQE